MKLFENSTFSSKLFSLIIITLICGLITIIFLSQVTLVYSSILGISTNQLTENVDYLRTYQVLSSIGLFIIPSILFSIFFDKNLTEGLMINTKPKTLSLIISIIAILSSLPIINYLTEINSHLALPENLSSIETWMREKEDKALELTNKMLITNDFSRYLINLLVIALIPALSEELFFRGTIQKLLMTTKLKPIICAFITSFIFSFFHFQFYGFIPRLVLGLMLGLMLVYSKNLWLPIIAHFSNNALAVTLYYLGKSEDVETMQFSIIIVLISIIIPVTLLLYLKKTEKNTNK
ncbi:MAG: CPBP family intramembrane metalloprotease [Bacteroidales bacterium]|nr:CPBP family intramembrane metalloprotease [Bacteroidales bacterium]